MEYLSLPHLPYLGWGFKDLYVFHNQRSRRKRFQVEATVCSKAQEHKHSEGELPQKRFSANTVEHLQETTSLDEGSITRGS